MVRDSGRAGLDVPVGATVAASSPAAGVRLHFLLFFMEILFLFRLCFPPGHRLECSIPVLLESEDDEARAHTGILRDGAGCELLTLTPRHRINPHAGRAVIM